MHRDVRVPLAAVTSVDVVDEPIRRIQGLKPRNFKIFGRYWPGQFAYGFLLRRGRTSAAVRRRERPEAPPFRPIASSWTWVTSARGGRAKYP